MLSRSRTSGVPKKSPISRMKEPYVTPIRELLTRVHLSFPALKHIAAAPKASPLSKVNALQVGQYLLSVMDEAVQGCGSGMPKEPDTTHTRALKP